MDTCSVETGLLRKKPCGHPSVTHCINCERPLCSQHAVAQLTEAAKHSGKFLCKECQAAWRDIAKTQAPAPAKKPAEPAKAGPAKQAPAKQAPAESKPAPAESKPAPAESGTIEFTPTKK
jgi:hypothetical protein